LFSELARSPIYRGRPVLGPLDTTHSGIGPTRTLREWPGLVSRGNSRSVLSMAGLAINLVQSFRTLRVLHWVEFTFEAGFELPSSWSAVPCFVLGPVPASRGLALWLSKRSQRRAKCEDRLPYYKDSSCSLPLATTPRPRLHDPRGPRRGRGRPGSRARSSGALAASMQREGAVPDNFVQNKMTRASHLWAKALSTN
jgi:hypothetical protein